MIKFAAKLLFSLSLLSSTYFSQASIITNLTDEQLTNSDFSEAQDFLTADFSGIHFITRNGWDIAWASPVNAEFWYGLPTYIEYDSGESLKNTLYSPLVQKNWMFVEDSGLSLSDLINSISLADFIRQDEFGNDVYIQATQYFNSHFHYVDATNLAAGEIRSQWVAQEEFPFSMFFDHFGQFETFYVRRSIEQQVSEVPEPSTLLILAIGLITLSVRARITY